MGLPLVGIAVFGRVLRKLCFPVGYLKVIVLSYSIGWVIFWTLIFVYLEGIESTLDITGGDAIHIEYITQFQHLEVDFNYGIAEVYFICGWLFWVQCCHCNFWQHKRLIFHVSMGRHLFLLNLCRFLRKYIFVLFLYNTLLLIHTKLVAYIPAEKKNCQLRGNLKVGYRMRYLWTWKCECSLCDLLVELVPVFVWIFRSWKYHGLYDSILTRAFNVKYNPTGHITCIRMF